MRLPKTMKDRLAAEFSFAVQRMDEESHPLRKLFFFSAFYGEAGRVLNWSWDADLALVHQVTQATYQQLQARVKQELGGERTITLDPQIFDVLSDISHELALLIADKEIGDTALKNVLARFAELSYSTTGNGGYLVSKGMLEPKTLR